MDGSDVSKSDSEDAEYIPEGRLSDFKAKQLYFYLERILGVIGDILFWKYPRLSGVLPVYIAGFFCLFFVCMFVGEVTSSDASEGEDEGNTKAPGLSKWVDYSAACHIRWSSSSLFQTLTVAGKKMLSNHS